MYVKTQPWRHQIKALEHSLEHKEFALFMEMRTGKSLVIIETALRYYHRGQIDGMLVLAPNGVHDNWVAPTEGEVAAHWPEETPYSALAWSPKTTVRYTKMLDTLLHPGKQKGRFAILSMNYEALNTARGAAVAKRFLETYRSLLVADESDLLKSPRSGRSKVAHKLAPLAAVRRILTGTPVTQSPLDLWSQFHFLRPGILHPSFPVFRARHVKLLPPTDPMVRNLMRKNNMRFAPSIPQTDDSGRPIYTHLDEIEAAIRPYSFRVLRTDCRDMPAKNYVRLRVAMSAEQHRLYDQMRLEYVVELADKQSEAPLVLTRMMRLQQIVGGFVEDEPIFQPGHNPRINAMLDIIEGTTGKVIIWARFVPELLAIYAALVERYGKQSAALYYGATPMADRLESRRRFLLAEDPLRFMVGQPSSGGVGVPMHSADTVFYYSNEFKLRTRLQSEDRAQHMDKTTPVEYYDLECPGTIDSKVITALRNKHDVAREVTGDNWKEWI